MRFICKDKELKHWRGIILGFLDDNKLEHKNLRVTVQRRGSKSCNKSCLYWPSSLNNLKYPRMLIEVEDNYEATRFLILHEIGHYADWISGKLDITSYQTEQREQEISANTFALILGGIPAISPLFYIKPALKKARIGFFQRRRLLKQYYPAPRDEFPIIIS